MCIDQAERGKNSKLSIHLRLSKPPPDTSLETQLPRYDTCIASLNQGIYARVVVVYLRDERLQTNINLSSYLFIVFVPRWLSTVGRVDGTCIRHVLQNQGYVHT